MQIAPLIFTKKSALNAVGGLSDTSKMPGKSYGLPTSACVTGSKLAQVPGTICHHCYAMRGHYLWPNVLEAQQRRLAAMNDPAWVEAMVAAIDDHRWFRWFDSGDLPSLDALQKIVAVARATPSTRHWLPTRERGFVARFLQTGSFPENLTVRLSSTWPDVPALPAYGLPVANVHRHLPPVGYVCPAPTQGNSCGNCRACWHKGVPAVSYHWH